MIEQFVFGDQAEEKVLRVFYVGSINAKSTGDTLVFTTANDTKEFLITDVFLVWENVVGYGSGPNVNLGQTGASYQDVIVAASIPVGATHAYNRATFTASQPLTINANTGVYARVAIAGTGTTLTLGVYVKGFYRV